LRGIRYVSDFEYEKSIADVNRMMDDQLETIFLTCSPEYSSFSSTLVRDIIRNGGDAVKFLPKEVRSSLGK
jgi:pantetheine-phosphate adenylyltransferase